MHINFFLITALLLLPGPLAAAMNLPHTVTSQNGALSVDYASSVSVKMFTVVVGRTGFNGTSSTFTLQVNQGDDVKIVFLYGDSDLSYDNPHIITIAGYGITTATLDKSNPNRTVEFVAGQVGSFKFYCSTPCLGMENLQQGVLDVRSGGSGTVKTLLTMLHCHMHSGNMLHMIIALDDLQGNPVPGVLVHFDLNTTLGWMEIGRNVTATAGYSEFMYPLGSSMVDVVAALFPGSGIYAPSNATATFAPGISGDLGGAPFLSGQNSLIDFRLVGIPPYVTVIIVSLVLLVVASVWLTYGYVVKQILDIRRHSSKSEDGGSA